MTGLLRALVLAGMIEAAVVATAYLFWGDWRTRGRVGWFLLLLGGSVAYLLAMSVISWWWEAPPRLLWLPGLIVFDVALGLWLSLLLRRRVTKTREDE